MDEQKLLEAVELVRVRNAEHDATAAGTEQRRVAVVNLAEAMTAWVRLMNEQDVLLKERKYWP